MRLVFRILLIILLAVGLFVFGMEYSEFVMFIALLIYLEVKFGRLVENQ